MKTERAVEAGRVSAVGEAEIQSALVSSFADFEDAIQHAAARTEQGVKAIIPRNRSDFAGSEIPVMSAEEYLARPDLRSE